MFGKSYLLDMYNCKIGTCDDMELHYRFLEELTWKLGMTPMSRPFIIHGPSHFSRCIEPEKTTILRHEDFPDKAGISGFAPLIESGITIHSLEPSNFSSMDVYTCGKLDIEIVRQFAQEIFGFTKYEEYLINRGVNFK